MDELDALGDLVPTEARPALITAAQSVLQNDSAAFNVCPTCGEGGSPSSLSSPAPGLPGAQPQAC